MFEDAVKLKQSNWGVLHVSARSTCQFHLAIIHLVFWQYLLKLEYLKNIAKDIKSCCIGYCYQKILTIFFYNYVIVS